MTIVVSKLQVPDYDRWAAQFEAGADSREAFGIRVVSFGHDASNRNIAVTIIEVESVDKLKEIFESPTLQSNIEKEQITILEVLVVER